MQETGHSKPVHWDNPERWNGEGAGRGVQDGGHMCTPGWFTSMYSKNHCNIVISLQFKKRPSPIRVVLGEVGLPKKQRQILQTILSISSVQFSRSVVSDSLRPHESQHARPPCPLPAPGVHPNSCVSSRWCHLAISTSVVPFSSCPKSLPASGSFPMSQLIAWGGQSTGVSASASFLPMNTQDCSPLGWTGWISLQSKGLSRVFSNTTVQKHQFFGTQLSSQSDSH